LLPVTDCFTAAFFGFLISFLCVLFPFAMTTPRFPFPGASCCAASRPASHRHRGALNRLYGSRHCTAPVPRVPHMRARRSPCQPRQPNARLGLRRVSDAGLRPEVGGPLSDSPSRLSAALLCAASRKTVALSRRPRHRGRPGQGQRRRRGQDPSGHGLPQGRRLPHRRRYTHRQGSMRGPCPPSGMSLDVTCRAPQRSDLRLTHRPATAACSSWSASLFSDWLVLR
jgi:hypothetical protein